MTSIMLSEMNEQRFRDLFARSADVKIQSFSYGKPHFPHAVLLLYCEGMADSKRVNEVVLPHLNSMLDSLEAIESDTINRSKTLQLQQITEPKQSETMMLKLYAGELILFFEGPKLLYSLDISQPPQRTPEESSTEVSIKGPRDAFTESLITNVALVRKRLKTHSLCYEKFVIGERSRTSLALLYIEDIIRPEIVEEAKLRLTDLKIDALISSGQLENPSYALFPLIDYIGRPDYVADSLLRGRFALIVDGSPMALIAPVNLMMILKSPEDVHLPFYYVSLERLLRLMGLILALFLPGFWIAVSSYNLDQIPLPLLATIASSRFGQPLSGTFDFFLMLALFELFREAGLRLPKAVGQTVAVVGGLIIGDAAIQAGLTSPITLVIAAVSIISMFTLINQSLAGTISVIRILILIASSIFGMFGFVLAVAGLALYLSTLESFGIPYLAPLSPPKFKDMVAAVFSKPVKLMKRRPSFLQPDDPTRQGGDTP